MSLTNQGKITVNGTIDREETETYTLTIVASDGERQDTLEVTISFTSIIYHCLLHDTKTVMSSYFNFIVKSLNTFGRGMISNNHSPCVYYKNFQIFHLSVTEITS